MPAKQSDYIALIRIIKEELNQLFADQSKALHEAVYIGMRPDEVKNRVPKRIPGTKPRPS